MKRQCFVIHFESHRYRDVSWMKFITIYRLSQNRCIIILSLSWAKYRDSIVSQGTWWYPALVSRHGGPVKLSEQGKMPKQCACGTCKSACRYPQTWEGGCSIFCFPNPKRRVVGYGLNSVEDQTETNAGFMLPVYGSSPRCASNVLAHFKQMEKQDDNNNC